MKYRSQSASKVMAEVIQLHRTVLRAGLMAGASWVDHKVEVRDRERQAVKGANLQDSN